MDITLISAPNNPNQIIVCNICGYCGKPAIIGKGEK